MGAAAAVPEPSLSIFLWVRALISDSLPVPEKLVKNAFLPLSLGSQSLDQLCTPFEPSKVIHIYYIPTFGVPMHVPVQEG